jgi:prevent-host-death family protein
MPENEERQVAIGVTALKARCLALIDAVAQGKTSRILLTKRNRPVAVVVPLEHDPAELGVRCAER